jgi:hypothetical protein
MKKLFLSLLTISFVILINGCLVFNKVTYTIQPHAKKGGTATVVFHDIKSDAIGNKEFDEDKNILFDFMLESDDFVTDMKQEGKKIKSRELFVEENKLNAKVSFAFDEISVVEGMQYQDGYYFLTIPVKDSILSTNGVVIPSKEHKRIIWDKSIKELKFEMLSDAATTGLRELAPHYKKK